MKRIRRTAAGAAALLVAAAIGAGCGSSEQSNDYVDEVNGLQVELVTQVTDVVSGAQASSPKQAAGVAADLRDVFETKAEELEAVEPPEDVAELHDQLVAEVRDVADQIAKAEEAFTSGDPQEAAQAAVALQTATTKAQTDLNTVIDAINSQLQN